MLSDYHVTQCSRQCATTGRQLQPGETYYSTLESDGASTVRRDFSAEAWQQPPEEAIAWWQSRVASGDGAPRLAPSDVLLNLFVETAQQPGEAEFRYLLGLLLLRKRIVRLEETQCDDDGAEILVLNCPRRREQYELRVAVPDPERGEQLQQRLIDLLFSDGQ